MLVMTTYVPLTKPAGSPMAGVQSLLSLLASPLRLGGQKAISEAPVEPPHHHAHGPGLFHRQRHARVASAETIEQMPSGGADARGGSHPGERAAGLELGYHVVGRRDPGLLHPDPGPDGERPVVQTSHRGDRRRPLRPPLDFAQHIPDRSTEASTSILVFCSTRPSCPSSLLEIDQDHEATQTRE